MEKSELQQQLEGVLLEIKGELAAGRNLSSRMESLDREYTELKSAIDALSVSVAESKAAPVEQPSGFVNPARVIAKQVANDPNMQAVVQRKAGHGVRSAVVQTEFNTPFDRKAAVGDANYGYQSDTSRRNDARTILSVENDPRIERRDQRPLVVYDLFGKRPAPGAPFIQWVQESSRTKNADGVPEGNLKPNSSIVTTNKTSEAVTIATHITVSRQLLADVDEFESFIEEILMNACAEHLEDQMLYGDGDTDSGNLQGLLDAGSGVSTQAFSTNVLDTIRAGVKVLRKANWNQQPDAVVVNHDDHFNMDVLKGSDGHYLWLDRMAPAADGMTAGVWRIPVVPTNAINSGYGLLGNFRTGAQIREVEPMRISVSYDNEDNFVKNMVTVLAEVRLHFITRWPTRFVKLGLISGY